MPPFTRGPVIDERFKDIQLAREGGDGQSRLTRAGALGVDIATGPNEIIRFSNETTRVFRP
jgi:hypothetical protein